MALPLPFFNPETIALYLQNQWSGPAEGTFRLWTTPTVTYFLGSSVVVDGGNSEGDGWMAMSADQAAKARKAFTIWQELVAGINFVELTGQQGADITFAYSTTTSNGGTYTSPTLGADIGTVPNVAVF